MAVIETTSEDETAYLLVDRLLTLSSRTLGAVQNALRELELSEPLANLLWHLDPEYAPPTMGELAGKLYCDPSTVTFLTGRLEERGLIERRASERDRRVRVVALTESGRALRSRLVEIVTTGSPLGTLGVGEREQLLRLLVKAAPFETRPPTPDCFG